MTNDSSKKSGKGKENNSEIIEKQAILLNVDTFERFCFQHGYSFKWDMIKHEMIYLGFDAKESVEHLSNNAPTILQGQLRSEGYKNATIDNICGCINVLGTRQGNRFNAILDKINVAEWDGVDRVEQIFKMWQIPFEDSFSRTLIIKWLKQCICLLHNEYHDPFSGEIVLVFMGGQGSAKTRFFEHLAMDSRYFGEGKCINPDNKDSIIEATSVWICELGEIGSTMRKDVDKVKAFITLAADEYRVPYARTHERHPRLTSFCGTVNDEQFLLDHTGNRRWATVKLPKDLYVDYNTQIKPFNSLQLWAQINDMINEDIANGCTYSNCFRLTTNEQAELNRINYNYTKPIKAFIEVEDTINDILYNIPSGHELDYKLMSATALKKEHDVLEKYSANQIGQVLKKLGYEQMIKKIDGKTLRGYILPFHKKI